MSTSKSQEKQYAWHVGLKYGFATKEHSKFDMHYNDDGDQYSVFANHWDGSNVLIKFKPEELT